MCEEYWERADVRLECKTLLEKALRHEHQYVSSHSDKDAGKSGQPVVELNLSESLSILALVLGSQSHL